MGGTYGYTAPEVIDDPHVDRFHPASLQGDIFGLAMMWWSVSQEYLESLLFRTNARM